MRRGCAGASAGACARSARDTSPAHTGGAGGSAGAVPTAPRSLVAKLRSASDSAPRCAPTVITCASRELTSNVTVRARVFGCAASSLGRWNAEPTASTRSRAAIVSDSTARCGSAGVPPGAASCCVSSTST
ncbi:Uncharacterised protein [Burkholderia pseudomallei]|nr:Uncharacterised protein [Burkholderia pseudomallei]CAJ3853448.1 Uncharacterised protein [Burkholderia pseudomallei]CAJ3871246.1 Uncharacterised protein [Burkholderia pseudomallei]CAJ3888758.1 Uncharacterised protein [Burkholderia pseudomallei]CAJ4079963.1 Uncharacterised protein [Burkholderia pseudomallei]